MVSTRPDIVLAKPEHLSRQWAQRIVDQHVSAARVADVCVDSVNVGTSTRWRITVQHDAQAEVPSRWFIKTPSLAWRSRLITALPRLLHKEVSFYKALAPSLPVRLPKILAAQTRWGGSTLVMADLAEFGHRAGQSGEALTAEQAVQVVDNLARFHGRFWGNAHLLREHRWLNGFSQQIEHQMGTVLAVPLMKRGLRRAGGLVPTRLHGTALNYARNRRRITQSLSSGTKTLIHHDCHPGNLFWTSSGPGFLDWQLVRAGEGIGDLAYFMATALTPEVRRAHERSLLQRYLGALSEQGIDQLDESGLLRRYRAHLLYPFEAMVVTLAIGGLMDAEPNLEMIRRASAAVDDHDSYAALDLR
ncbi:aminoglycoside phosphotransferase [Methylomonas sp. LWB]|uniref:Aminoglycoside phosphotransferase n=1 Tax=Methylomonas koyamae TaxID=702114 RepID=A0A177P8R0_9GAMM|nr:aminoglycoside phosphotransferase [Methylomonas koyamae]OHX37159.1 aminoglycoside phosphotransferase [Methylomonas sp. LWB]